MENKPDRVIVHHTADAFGGPQLDRVNHAHKLREFPYSALGWYVGYHYLIEKNGKIMQTRRDDEIGAHTIGANATSIGIALAGNFSKEHPTPEQERSLAELLGQLVDTYKIPSIRIIPHRWESATECPGTLLPDDWARRLYIGHKLSWIKKILLAILAKIS